MSFGHEQLDVYRVAIGYVAWVHQKAAVMNGTARFARDQWLRASQSNPLNVAEGIGKAAAADRRRSFEIARGSALECAAIQDILVACNALDQAESDVHKAELDRIVAMLSRLGGRGYCAGSGSEKLRGNEQILRDGDSGSDTDFKKHKTFTRSGL